MIDLDFTHCPLPPYAHQRDGVHLLVERPTFALFDEMGCGKSAQVITAACILFEQDIIDKMLIVCPAAVRGVWFNESFGELKKHRWPTVPFYVTEFHTKCRTWTTQVNDPRLRIVVTNFDYVRSKARLQQLLPFCTPKTLLVIDEATAVKTSRTQQAKAVLQLRRACGRVVALTGTPVTNQIGDLFSIGNILDPRILNCSSYTHFKARYAIYGGFKVNGRPVQITGWRDVPQIQAAFAPYVIRRLKKDVLDLPAKLDPVTLITTLTPETWAIYKSMKNELVAWLSSSTVSQAPQAVTKIMRLQQITSGFLGGIEEMAIGDGELLLNDKLPDADVKINYAPVQTIGREKLDTILTWVRACVEEDPNFKLVIWARFRLELQRLVKELSTVVDGKPIVDHVGAISGGQKPAEREAAIQLLDPRTTPRGSVAVVGNPASGGMGISLVAANNVIYASNSPSVVQRSQSEDRTCRPGQTVACSFFDVVAEGPQGQQTIDATILKALRNNIDIGAFTTAAWIHALKDEG